MKLSGVLEGCSASVGMCIALGKNFFEKGIDEVDTTIMPHLEGIAEQHIHPRVLLSYGILLWFSMQVS